jgi:hypothetical protein
MSTSTEATLLCDGMTNTKQTQAATATQVRPGSEVAR